MTLKSLKYLQAPIVETEKTIPSYKTAPEAEPTRGMMPFTNKAIASGLGAIPDALNWGVNKLLPEGYKIENPVGGSDSFESAMGMSGINLPEKDQEPQSFTEHVGRGVGEGAVALLPIAGLLNKLRVGTGIAGNIANTMIKSIAKHPYMSMTGELTGGAGAGGGRSAGKQVFPNSPGAQSTAEIVGGVIGGMAPTAILHAPTRVALKTGKSILKKIIKPFTKAGKTKRAAQFVKGLVKSPGKTIPKIYEDTIGDLPPAVASGEKRLIEVYKSLIGQDPQTDFDTIEKLTRSAIDLESELRTMGYGSPDLLAEVTEKRIAALEIRMDRRILAATEKAQDKLSKVPTTERQSAESTAVRQELEAAKTVENDKVKEIWGTVNKDIETPVENTRQAMSDIDADLAFSQRSNVPKELRTDPILVGEDNVLSISDVGKAEVPVLPTNPKKYNINPKVLSTQDGADREFQRALTTQYPNKVPVYHETFLENVDSIINNGLREESNFGSVGEYSNFITKKDKAIVKVRADHDLISPDMQYDPENPAKDLLKQHNGTKGAYVSLNGEIPPNQIESITIIRNGKKAETIMGPDFSRVIKGPQTDDMSTVKEMQGLRSKLLEIGRKARKEGDWGKSRIANKVASAILDDLDVASSLHKGRSFEVGGGTPPKEGYVPAYTGLDGDIYYGKKNQLHYEVADDHNALREDGSVNIDEEGFADSSGRFFTRSEAADNLNTNRKELYSENIGDSSINPDKSNLKAALAATRHFKTRFEEGVVGDILGFSKSGAPSIDPTLTLDISVGRGGRAGAVDMDKVVVSPAAKAATSKYLGRSFSDFAAPDGIVDPTKAKKWIKSNEDILDKYPELRQQLMDAGEAQRGATVTINQMNARKKSMRNPKISKSEKFVKTNDMGTSIDTMFKVKSGADIADDLVRKAAKDSSGDSIEGVRAGTLDYMIDRSMSNAYNELGEKTISGKGLLHFIKGNKSILKRVFTPDQIDRMNQIGSELNKIDMFEASSSTPIDMKDTASSLLQTIVKIGGARLGGWMGRESIGGSMQMARMGTERGKNLLKHMTQFTATQMIEDAILADKPDLLKALLLEVDDTPATKENWDIINKQLNAWMGGTGKRVMEDINKEVHDYIQINTPRDSGSEGN